MNNPASVIVAAGIVASVPVEDVTSIVVPVTFATAKSVPEARAATSSIAACASVAVKPEVVLSYVTASAGKASGAPVTLPGSRTTI